MEGLKRSGQQRLSFAPAEGTLGTTDARTSAWLATASAAKKTARAPTLGYRA